ncbi:uncharacterized protein LOC108097781 [Drosophila ficusphila]|uniref:uncharacterized protein LOC108097781 n=1 Tax=Drosophila ficusphila TaxID=30025 RepID=UPI0007E6D5E5|nr:uncharacterized protein LOC108097781 [Drosophila ficusphila]
MVLPQDRLDYYKKNFEQQLKLLVISIKGYKALKAAKTPELSKQANRLWELSQRYRLVKGANQSATFALLSVCREVYQSLQDNILTLDYELVQISAQVTDFENKCLELQKEQNQTRTSAALTEIRNFLEELLKLLQNQVKYLELHLRQLQPKFMAPESSLESFKSDLELSEYAEAKISLGLAKLERFSSLPLNLL